MRTTLGIGALVVVTAGAVAAMLPSDPGPRAPLRSIDLGVQSPATPDDGPPPAAAPVPSGPASVPQAPVPAPEPAPMPTGDDAAGRDRDGRVELDDDRDDPDEPDDD